MASHGRIPGLVTQDRPRAVKEPCRGHRRPVYPVCARSGCWRVRHCPGVESLGGHHAPAMASSLYIYALQPRAEMRADAASGWSPWRRRRSWVTAEGVIGGNLDQDDPDAVGVLDPHLGRAPGLRGGSRMTGHARPRPAGRARRGHSGHGSRSSPSARQGRQGVPRPRAIPGRGRIRRRDPRGAELPVDGQAE